ncbi:MAG: ribonuclease J [Bacilli bacterium]|nr:ribonuclease J [Bacilli bacterium]
MNDKIRICALGGLDEEGKNCLVVEINDDIFVVEAGIMEPDKTMPGVDYVIPRFDYLVENKSRLRAYFLLHGHDDETGALAYIYEQAPAPIYGSKVTLAMLSLFTRHVKKDPKMYQTVVVEPSSTFKVAGRNITFFHTAHNIADSSGMAIETSLGQIVITGDFVVENAADPSFLSDMNAIARLAEKPTLALLPESVYAERPGYTAPLYKLTPHIQGIFKNATGRIFVSVFSANLYNITEVIRLALAEKRKIACYDAATLDTLQTMQECGSVLIPRDSFVHADDIIRQRDSDLVILMTGFGAKLFRKIALLASGQNEDKRIKIKPTDSFIIASPSDDNTEIEFVDAADELFRTQADVTIVPKKNFLRMHASEEDLRMMASIFKPKYYIPIKGFYKSLLRNAMSALTMGINLSHQNVFVVENGISILIDEKGGRVFDEKIPHGDLMIDGDGVGDISQNVLSDRQKLAEGVVIIAMTISRSRAQVVAGPETQMRGLLVARDAETLQRECSKIALATAEEFLQSPLYNLDEIKQNAYEKVGRMIRRVTGKEPMVLPLFTEVD